MRSGVLVTWFGLMGVLVLVAIAVAGSLVGAGSTNFLRYKPDDLETMFYSHPNETNTLEAYVNNTGDLSDSFVLTMSFTDNRWSGHLDSYRIDDIPPGSQALFNATETAPTDAQEGWMTKVTLTATSVLSNATDTITWYTFIIVTRGVEMTCMNPIAEMASNTTVRFILNITNSGEAPDTFGLNSSIDPVGAGWMVSLSNETIALGKGEQVSMTVNVTSPLMGIENGTVSVNIHSLADSRVASTLILTCRVIPEWTAILDPSSSTFDVAPGTVREITLRLSEQTNTNTEQGWSAILSSTSPEWLAAISPSEFGLLGVAMARLILNITVPERSLAGNTTTVDVILTCAQVPAHPLVSRFEFRTMAVHGLHAAFSYIPEVPPSAEHTNVTISARNEGNIEEAFQLIALLPEGWQIESSMGPVQGPWFSFMPWASEDIEARIIIPISASSGTHQVHFSLRSSNVESENTSIPIDVPRRVQLHLFPVDTDGIMIEPGERDMRLRVSMENLGNAKESIRMEASCDHSGCTMVPINGTLVLSPGSTGTAVLGLSVRADSPYGLAAATVVAHVVGTEVNWTLVLNFSVVGPDLEISGAKPNGNPVERKPIWIAVTIRNVGQGAANATDVAIYLRKGERQLGTGSVGPLAAGESVNINVSIIPVAGNHTYILEVNLHDFLREDGKAANTFLLVMDAKSIPQGDNRYRSSVFFIIVLVVVIIVLALSAWFLVQRVGKGRTRPPS